MKWLTFTKKDDPQSRQRVGVLYSEDKTLDLQAAQIKKSGKTEVLFSGMLEALADWENARKKAEELLQEPDADCVYPLEELVILAPAPRPASIRDCSLYEEHMINCGRVALILKGAKEEEISREDCKPGKSWYSMPIYYKGNPWTVVGTGTDIYFPEGEGFRDYELELGFFVGKKGKDIPPEHALEYIAGFTIFNDFSARLTQLSEMTGQNYLSPAKGKDFDTGNAMGPYLVTPDEFDYTSAKMTVKVNGELRGGGVSGDTYYKLPDVIAHISRSETIYPGDFIGFGTVPTGTGLEFMRPLADGDVVELEIEGIGKLVNRVVR